MKISEVVNKYKFLNPRELSGSYSSQQLRDLGFRQASNGGWYIERTKWNQLIKSGQLRENSVLDKKTLSIDEIAKKHKTSVDHIRSQLYKGIKIEMEHTTDKAVANEIARDHLSEDPHYYDKLASLNLEEMSGYIPTKKQANDPRFKTALTIDVHPDSIRKNIKKLGLGNIKHIEIPILNNR
jgi:hypothetical protein